MSEHELSDQKKKLVNEEGESAYQPVLDVFEANHVNEQAREKILREHYTSLDFPCCGDYMEPDLASIKAIKDKKGKNFVQGQKVHQSQKINPFDGLYEHEETESQILTNQLIREKTRFNRDGRQEFFQENGDLFTEKQFFHSHLSRLANISFEQNYAIRTFQKNAILSERNNQKKSIPFELEINIGCLWINHHSLQNNEQRKFEELRPLFKEFSSISAYPALPELSREIEYLRKIEQRMLETDATPFQKQQIQRKIQIATSFYQKEVERVKLVMLEVLAKWKELKQERRSSGLETVPWKLNVKEYQIDGQRSFDIGLTPMELIPLNDARHPQNVRRENIKKERYFVKVYINGYEVAKSEKVHLQWPSFRIPINQKFNVTVYSAPSSIQVEIIKVGIINQTIDTISLALPGINSKTITSSEQRYAGAAFALNGPKYRKGEKQVEAPAGMVIYRIEWKGQGSRMPPVSFKAQEQETAPTEQTEDDIDYQQLYDIKDPRVHHKARRDQIDGNLDKGHGALLPFAQVQSARHLLLKMKATQVQMSNIQIPLLEEQIRKRQDLLAIIQSQKVRSLENITVDQQEIYNPSEGFFKTQDEQVLQQIRELIFKLQGVKINAMNGGNRIRYKITEQIINQFIFEQMQSPIVIFFKNLFTQKRKLGPRVTYYQQARAVFDEMEINLHLRSARNIPIRQSAFAQIRNFQEQENRMNPARMHQMAGHTGNNDMYSNYGMGFYQRPPNMNIQGQNFFVPGMMNINQGRPNMEVSYQKKTLERNNSYVQFRFKKMLKTTECFEGPFPEWNETIEFNYNFKNEQMTLEKLFTHNEKMMKILVFDMTEQSKPTTSISEARIKKTKYYLGRIDIPMSLLVASPSLTGIFQLERPLLLFGYGIKRSGLFDYEPDLEEANRTEFPDIHTFLNLDLFTDPLIDSLTAYNTDRKYVAGGDESTLLLQRASDWLGELNTKRYIRMWLNNLEGKSVFICRWLTNIAPPPQLGNQNLIERCARFVAMIPKKFTCKLLENTEEFHLTCEQFLTLKMGEDHGILLCNYFNFIDRQAGREHIESYLAIGKAFSYGKSIFVLRRDTRTNDCEMWDPYEGRCCFMPAKQYQNFCCLFRFSKKKDPQNQKDMCSMFELGCIVSKDNVYVNIQQNLKPQELDFALEDDKLWKPFLTERAKGEYFERGIIDSVQPEITEDFYPKIKGIESQLENRLYEYIRRNLQTERRRHFKPYTFKINSNISNIVRNILLSCQTLKMDHRLTGGDSRIYSGVSHEQKNKFPSAIDQFEKEKNKIKTEVDADKLLYGFTINVPYTSDRDLWERIQEAHLHLDETENIQFVLAIKCFELSCHIISVWVFIGSIA